MGNIPPIEVDREGGVKSLRKLGLDNASFSLPITSESKQNWVIRLVLFDVLGHRRAPLG